MMIEPKSNKTEVSVLDKFTIMAEKVLENVQGGAYCKGFHICVCGKTSGNQILSIYGKQTNSLLVHYVKEHRSEIPTHELEKLEFIYNKIVKN